MEKLKVKCLIGDDSTGKKLIKALQELDSFDISFSTEMPGVDRLKILRRDFDILIIEDSYLLDKQKNETIKERDFTLTWPESPSYLLIAVKSCLICGTEKIKKEDEIDEEALSSLLEKFSADDFILFPLSAIEIRERLNLARRKLQQRESWQDDDTGLLKESAFHKIVDREWRRGYRSSEPLSLIMIVIDFFSGEESGDSTARRERSRVLQKIGSTIGEAGFRPGDIAGKFARDVFTILLPGTNLKGAREVGRRIRRLINVTVQDTDFSDDIKASTGIAGIIPSTRDESINLVEAAREAMEKARQSEEDRVKCISGSEIESRMRLD